MHPDGVPASRVLEDLHAIPRAGVDERDEVSRIVRPDEQQA
jgi:hypothetical protein